MFTHDQSDPEIVDVITWASSNGATVHITPDQERRLTAAGVWPRDYAGAEYAQVSRGRHRWLPTYSDAEITALIAAAQGD